MPLHPVIVHFPIALSVLLPLVGAAVLAGWWSGLWPRATWGVAALLAGLLTVSAFVAVRTGEADEERAERTASEQVIETHEERAVAFAWFTVLPLLLAAGAAAFPREGVAKGLAGATVAASLLGTGLAYGVGHAGGAIVYGGATAADAGGGLLGLGGGEAGEADEDDDD